MELYQGNSARKASIRSSMVKDENGNACSTLETQSEKWQRHFKKILNLHSEFSEEELGRARQRPLW